MKITIAMFLIVMACEACLWQIHVPEVTSAPGVELKLQKNGDVIAQPAPLKPKLNSDYECRVSYVSPDTNLLVQGSWIDCETAYQLKDIDKITLHRNSEVEKRLKCGPLQHIEHPYCNVNPVECEDKCVDGPEFMHLEWDLNYKMPEKVERRYNSKTISVLMSGFSDYTAVSLTEHGNADFVWIEAFYWTTEYGQRLLLHKEIATPVLKGTTWVADIPLPIGKIVFIRVRETQTLNETKFGNQP